MKLVRRLMAEYGMPEMVARIADAYHQRVLVADTALRYGMHKCMVSERFKKAKAAMGVYTTEQALELMELLDRE